MFIWLAQGAPFLRVVLSAFPLADSAQCNKLSLVLAPPGLQRPSKKEQIKSRESIYDCLPDLQLTGNREEQGRLKYYQGVSKAVVSPGLFPRFSELQLRVDTGLLAFDASGFG